MTELESIEIPRRKPDATFEITGAGNKTIPVEVYFGSPFELATRVFVFQFVEGEKRPTLDLLFIDRAVYTQEYVITDLQCLPLFVAKDRDHFLYLMKERVLPHYDGDLVNKIIAVVR